MPKPKKKSINQQAKEDINKLSLQAMAMKAADMLSDNPGNGFVLAIADNDGIRFIASGLNPLERLGLLHKIAHDKAADL